jgi:hypothetical protein
MRDNDLERLLRALGKYPPEDAPVINLPPPNIFAR